MIESTVDQHDENWTVRRQFHFYAATVIGGKPLPFLRTFAFILCLALSLNSNIGFSQEIKSTEAAELLRDVVGNYPNPDQPSHELSAMNSRLVRMLFQNGQYDLAEEFAESRKEYQGKELLGKLLDQHLLRIAEHAEGGPLKENDLVMVTRIAGKSSVVMGTTNKRIDRLLELGQLDLAERITMALPGDLQSYKYNSGMINNQMSKMHLVAKLVKFNLITGDEKKAKDLLELFGELPSREQAKLSVIGNCYHGKPVRVDLAEKVYDWLETAPTKFWAAFRLGNHFVKQKQTPKVVKYAKLMDENYEHATKSSRVYFGKLLLNLAQLQINDGQSADWALDRFERVAKSTRDRLNFLLVHAISGNLEPLLERPDLNGAAVNRLNDFENESFRDSYSPLRLVDSVKRLETAIQIAEQTEHPYRKSQVLCQIATKLIPKARGTKIFMRRVSDLSLAVMDFDKAIWLADRAFDEAQKEAEPIIVGEDRQFGQSDAMQSVAKIYLKLGKLQKATLAIEKISSHLIENKDYRGAGTEMISQRNLFVRYYAQRATHQEEPFTINSGQQAIEFVKALAKYDVANGSSGVHSVVVKFAKLGLWKQAEQAFDLAHEKFGDSFRIPRELARAIAQENNAILMRHWQAKCSDSTLASFLDHYCGYWNDQRKLPVKGVLIEIDLKRDELSADHNCREIDTLLLIGFWVDGMDDYVDKQFLRLRKSRNPALPLVARKAMAFGFPKLAVDVAERIKDGGDRERTLLSFHRLSKSGSEFKDEPMPDEAWINSQSAEVRASLKMQKARSLLENLNN